MKFFVYILFLVACFRCSAHEIIDTNISLIANPILKDTAVLSQRTTLYLNSDKDTYLTGESIWFNLFVFNAQTFIPSLIDTNLLLLLRNEQNNQIVWSGSFHIQNTHGSGRITIADSLPTGKYLLSAYTAHSFFKHQERIIEAKELFIADNYDSIRAYNKLNTYHHYDKDIRNFGTEPLSINQQLINIESNTRNNIRFKIYGNHSDTEKYYLRLQCRGILEKIAVIENLKDSASVSFSTKGLTTGITEVILFDNKLKPIAERLVFIHPEEHLYVSIDTIKQQYDPKEKVTLKIHTKDIEGKPVSALLSVRATDRRFLNELQHNDIWTHTQLFSQFKEVNYNFENSNSWMPKALDNLLVKEDDHSYNWNSSELDKMTSDTPLLVNRYKARLIRKNGKPNKKPLSIMAFNPYNKKEERKIFIMTDSFGYFDITPEMQSLGANYMIKYFAKENQKIIPITKTNTSELINKPFVNFSNISSDERPSMSNNDTITNTILNDSTNYIESGVMITAKDNTRDRYLAGLDSIDYAETLDFIHYAYLLGQNGERFYVAEIHSKPIKESTLLSKGSHTYSEGERFGKKMTIIAPNQDTTTKPLDSILFDKFNLIEMNGYITNKAFCSPDYDKDDSTIDDYRNTLYWNPEIITDANGDAIVEFYTSDIRGPFEIMVEGVSMNGLLGSCNTNFQVRKKE